MWIWVLVYSTVELEYHTRFLGDPKVQLGRLFLNCCQPVIFSPLWNILYILLKIVPKFRKYWLQLIKMISHYNSNTHLSYLYSHMFLVEEGEDRWHCEHDSLFLLQWKEMGWKLLFYISIILAIIAFFSRKIIVSIYLSCLSKYLTLVAFIVLISFQRWLVVNTYWPCPSISQAFITHHTSPHPFNTLWSTGSFTYIYLLSISLT